jgi:hypothetical protein
MEDMVDGSIYEGDYDEGKKKGRGKLKFPNGSYYEGEFLDNQIHGFGNLFPLLRHLYMGRK